MIVKLIIAAVVSSWICSIINKNTIGTTSAYAKRWFGIFLVVGFILMCI